VQFAPFFGFFFFHFFFPLSLFLFFPLFLISSFFSSLFFFSEWNPRLSRTRLLAPSSLLRHLRLYGTGQRRYGRGFYQSVTTAALKAALFHLKRPQSSRLTLEVETRAVLDKSSSRTYVVEETYQTADRSAKSDHPGQAALEKRM
jgi:hypothetical protein